MPNCEVYFSKMPVDVKPKIHEGRKSSKPLMEKRRRARINDSLSQLKALILEATNKDSSRHSKLEKADILEMTVKHLRTVQRNHITGPHSADPNTVSRFRQGYSECIHEVARFFTNIENIGNTDMRLTLINHLAKCVNPPTSTTTTTPATQPSPPTSPVSMSPIAPLHVGQPTATYSSQVTVPSPAIAAAVVNPGMQASQPMKVQISPAGTIASTALTTTTNITASPVQPQYIQQHHVEAISPTAPTNTVAATPTQVISGIPVGIPGALSSGEITLVLPPQALPGGQLPSHFIPVYAQSLASPALSPAAAACAISAESPKAYAQVHVNTPQQITTVQASTLVAVPAPTPAVTPAPVARPVKSEQRTVPEPLSPPKTVLQAVNVQAVVEQEQVWRPWSRRE